MFKKDTIKKLPAPTPNPHEISAQRFWGLNVHPSSSPIGNKPFAIFWNGQFQTAVAHFTSQQFLDGYTEKHTVDKEDFTEVLPGLYKVFARLEDQEQGMMVLIRALRTSYAAKSKRILSLSGQTENQEYLDFLNKSKKWINPTIEGQYFGHDMLVWGPASSFIPRIQNQSTAAISPKNLIMYETSGSLLRDTLFRQPINYRSRELDPTSKQYDLLSWAAPSERFISTRFTGFHNHFHAYWLGELTEENIEPLLSSDLDILCWLRVVGSYMYATTIIRKEVVIDTTDPDPLFNKFSDTINGTLGKWDRQSGADVESAFKSFIPGGIFLPGRLWNSSIDFRSILDTLGKAVSPVGDTLGTIFLGKHRSANGNSHLIDPKTSPTIAFTGTSKTAGKSTTAAAAALSSYPIVWVALTATVEDRAPDWATRFGGKVKELRLPDADVLLAQKDVVLTLDTKKVQEEQSRLQEKDNKDARRYAKQLVQGWLDNNSQDGLPLVINPQVESIRVINWIFTFISEVVNADSLRRWYDRSRTPTIFVFDNFSRLNAILGSGDSGKLGKLPIYAAQLLATKIGDMLNNGANTGALTWVLTHDPKELSIAGQGINNFSLQIKLGNDDLHEMATLVRPKEGIEIEDQLYIKLPPYLLEYVEQFDVKKNGKGRLEEGEGVETIQALETSPN